MGVSSFMCRIFSLYYNYSHHGSSSRQARSDSRYVSNSTKITTNTEMAMLYNCVRKEKSSDFCPIVGFFKHSSLYIHSLHLELTPYRYTVFYSAGCVSFCVLFYVGSELYLFTKTVKFLLIDHTKYL